MRLTFASLTRQPYKLKKSYLQIIVLRYAALRDFLDSSLKTAIIPFFILVKTTLRYAELCSVTQPF
jgi:hypothetical protein